MTHEQNQPKPLNSLQAILEGYRLSIPTRLEALLNLIDEMRTNPSKGTLSEFRLQIHKLAGNAGTYGYAEVSRICREFDQILQEKIKDYEQATNVQEWLIDFDLYLEKIKKGFFG